MGTFMTPVENSKPALISPVELGDEGLAYVRMQLQDGGPLSKMVCEQFGDSGSVFAPLKNTIDASDACDFTAGLNNPTAAIRTWLADYVGSQCADCMLIAEDSSMTADDKLKLAQPYYFFSDSIPYFAPTSANLDAALTTIVHEMRSWNFSIFVIAPSVPLPAKHAAVDTEDIALLARQTRAVLVSAYDRSGYVVWRK
jgi:hypothetical protein